jgi:hypothetical protein
MRLKEGDDLSTVVLESGTNDLGLLLQRQAALTNP